MGSIRLLRLLLERGQYPWHRPMVLKLATPRQVHGRAVGRDKVGDLAGLPPPREAEVRESTGHKNAQPTRPERNAQPADLHRPSKDDPQQMYYCHDEKQRGGDHHIGFSVQSAYPSASRPTTPDSSLRLITGDPYAVGHVRHPLSTLSTDDPICPFAS